VKFISNTIVKICDNDIYLKLYNDLPITNVIDFYIFLEDILTKIHKNEYDIFILNKILSYDDMFLFFENILNNYERIYILDKNDKMIYYTNCDDNLVEGIVKSIF
jgi:hypothetical protein